MFSNGFVWECSAERKRSSRAACGFAREGKKRTKKRTRRRDKGSKDIRTDLDLPRSAAFPVSSSHICSLPLRSALFLIHSQGRSGASAKSDGRGKGGAHSLSNKPHVCATKKQLRPDVIIAARCVEAERLCVFNAADSLIAPSYTPRTRTRVSSSS